MAAAADITRLRALGNRMLGTLVNLSHGTDYSDLCYGFNVFWQKHVPVLGLDTTSPPSRSGDGRLWGDGFEIETLIHLRVAEQGLRVAEVPSFEHSRIYGVSNLDAFSDGLRVLTTILVEGRARRQHRTRRRVAGAPVAVVPIRGLLHMETTFLRMLYALYSIDHGRFCVHRAGAPTIRPRTASPAGVLRLKPSSDVRSPTTLKLSSAVRCLMLTRPETPKWRANL